MQFHSGSGMELSSWQLSVLVVYWELETPKPSRVSSVRPQNRTALIIWTDIARLGCGIELAVVESGPKQIRTATTQSNISPNHDG